MGRQALGRVRPHGTGQPHRRALLRSSRREVASPVRAGRMTEVSLCMPYGCPSGSPANDWRTAALYLRRLTQKKSFVMVKWPTVLYHAFVDAVREMMTNETRRTARWKVDGHGK